MVREGWSGLPLAAPPAGFEIRPYAPGDEAHWLTIHLEADRLNSISADLFARRFGNDPRVLAERQLYVVAPDSAVVGTVTAWFDAEFRGGEWGRVHYLAVRPAFQRRGLGRALMSAACERLKSLGHRRAYLATDRARVDAIQLYRGFGFRELDQADVFRPAR